MKYVKFVTMREVIRGVPDRWRKQYAEWIKTGRVGLGRDKGLIADELDSLNIETCTAEDISRIIGNTSWAENHCDGCEEDRDEIMWLGEEPDYESRFWRLCRECFDEAGKLWPSK